MNRQQLDEFAILGIGPLIGGTIASLIPFIPTGRAGVTGDIGNLTPEDVEALLARGINPFQQGRQTGIPTSPVTPQPGFKPGGTGGPRRGGKRNEETKGQGFLQTRSASGNRAIYFPHCCHQNDHGEPKTLWL